MFTHMLFSVVAHTENLDPGSPSMQDLENSTWSGTLLDLVPFPNDDQFDPKTQHFSKIPNNIQKDVFNPFGDFFL